MTQWSDGEWFWQVCGSLSIFVISDTILFEKVIQRYPAVHKKKKVRLVWSSIEMFSKLVLNGNLTDE